ncbi:MAG: apolipoprotein N-acyltransferase [Candidatus Melainabacteria bacterium]|nr:apolipoprotein N-acyltransferase [Candidatus Melainabacteria bacterium]
MSNWSGLSFKRSLLLGAIIAVASLFGYPDNLHNLPGFANLIALIVLFVSANYLNKRIALHQSITEAATKSHDVITRDKTYYKHEAKIWLALALWGCVFGLIAPGFDQWYLAWFGMAPLLIFTGLSKNPPQAFYRGVFFGYAYNLVWSLFILSFSSAVWPENLRPFSALANAVVWLLYSLQQAALCGTFCFLVNWLPLRSGKWRLFAFLIVPLLWVLVFNKLGNALSSVAMPWTLIEYSQYKQNELMQCASLFGGIGISFLIVMSNVVVASLIASIIKRFELKSLAFPGRKSLIVSSSITVFLIFGCFLYGNAHLKSGTTCSEHKNKEVFSILQGNILFGLNEINPNKHWNCYLSLANSSAPGVCVWPEWSVPISISQNLPIFKRMDELAKKNNQDWIVGAVDSDNTGNEYNAACLLGKSGKTHPETYRKQYLVPFGEQSPSWLLNSPMGALCGTLTPRRKGYSAGREAAVFTSGENKVVPLICCELIAPELACSGVRKGGELLVDCSNTMWFQTKLLGDQSLAVCAMRAAENHRYFVFGTSSGPSAFIDWHGQILQKSALNQCCTLKNELYYDSKLTPFSRWFR